MLNPDRRLDPTTYFAPDTGVERAIQATRSAAGERGQRIGVIGLGAGTLAAYGRPGDMYRFYEINPQVVTLAQTAFTFLEDSGAETSVVTADGRLALEREAAQNFDVLVIDAFSGGSVPVHLLSREALALYFTHVRAEGIVAFHVSNAALRLASVIQTLAADGAYNALRLYNSAAPDVDRAEADWVLVSRERGVLDGAAVRIASTPFDDIGKLSVWTDDYSALLPILK